MDLGDIVEVHYYNRTSVQDMVTPKKLAKSVKLLSSVGYLVGYDATAIYISMTIVDEGNGVEYTICIITEAIVKIRVIESKNYKQDEDDDKIGVH